MFDATGIQERQEKMVLPVEEEPPVRCLSCSAQNAFGGCKEAPPTREGLSGSHTVAAQAVQKSSAPALPRMVSWDTEPAGKCRAQDK